MRIDSFSLPHPVLRPDGNVSGDFASHVKVDVRKNEVKIITDMVLTNEILNDLAQNKKVAFCLDVSCKYTIFRESYIFFDKRTEILIPASKLRDTTEVNCYLVATTDIANYKNTYENDIYDNKTFKITKGEILGYSGRDTFEVEKDWETPEVGGAFFVLDKHIKKDVKYELGSDPILIKIPEKDFKIMHEIKKNENLKAVFYTLYAYPAMLYVLSEISEGKGEGLYAHRRWYKRLQEILNSSQYSHLSLSPEDYPRVAQMIFQYPLSTSLQDIQKIILNTGER